MENKYDFRKSGLVKAMFTCGVVHAGCVVATQ